MGIPFHAFEVLGNGAAGDRHAVAVQMAMIQQRLHQQRDATSFEHVFGHIAATRLQIRDIWCLFEDFGHIEQVEFDSAFVRHRGQMQRRVGRTAGGRDHGGRVFQRLAGDDVARADVARDQVHDLLARRHAEAVADFIRRRRAGRIRQREADSLGDGRHGVGGELRAAGARRWARHALDLVEVLIGHLTDRVLADRLEHVLDGDLLAAIDEDRRHVQAQHRHHHAGQGLVAARQPDQGVIGMAADGQFDRIRDGFPRRQRRAHALVAHGNAVGHGDGAEFARGAAGGGDALLGRLGLAHQRNVAGRGFIPAGRHPDERLVDLLGGQAHGIEVGAMGRARGTFRHVTARQTCLDVGLRVHSEPLPPAVNAENPYKQEVFPKPSRATWRSAYKGKNSWRGVAKSRRAQGGPAAAVKCSRTVVATQHSLRRGNDVGGDRANDVEASS